MARGSIGLEDGLNAYVAKNHPQEHPVLGELRKATAKLPNAMMQISPEQGHFLAFLAKLIGAKNCIEIGVFTGYSALAVALALPKDGKLIACDINEEWTSIGRKHWEKAGVAAKIDLRLAPGVETLKALTKAGHKRFFDMAFIDAWKPDYDAYYEMILPLMRKGGLIAFDNMLWSGKVADPKVRDADTVALRALNKKIAGDDRVDSSLLPLGDGVMLARVR